MKATRVFQLTALALVVVSVVQVGWWLLDRHAQTHEKVRAARAAYTEQTSAAQALLDAGVSAQRVHQLLPQIVVADGQATLAPQVDEALRTEERHRDNQYAWEGSFFLLALGACIAVIARALRAEARVLEQQDSFLALVSHQFKTPLASLQLSLETMALRTLSPEQSPPGARSGRVQVRAAGAGRGGRARGGAPGGARAPGADQGLLRHPAGSVRGE